jgi:membrane protease YdiL (CAAX protease family)
MKILKNLHLTALLEIGLMFLPAIPAYLWIWPNLEGALHDFFQDLTYIYVLVGTLIISMRRYKMAQLGLNRQGLGLSLVCGIALVLGRSLVILSVDWGSGPPAFRLAEIFSDFLFYFFLVAITEELLFRGLLYHALGELGAARGRGPGLAIWGSSFGFMLWHIFGQGPLIGAATFFYGLIFALLRWRAGGIVGPILVHGAIDFFGDLMLVETDIVDLSRPEVPHPAWLFAGLILIVAVPFYLWLAHPAVARRLRKPETRGK